MEILSYTIQPICFEFDNQKCNQTLREKKAQPNPIFESIKRNKYNKINEGGRRRMAYTRNVHRRIPELQKPRDKASEESKHVAECESPPLPCQGWQLRVKENTRHVF